MDPRTLSGLEQKVWAAEFVRALAEDASPEEASISAGTMVEVLREVLRLDGEEPEE